MIHLCHWPVYHGRGIMRTVAYGGLGVRDSQSAAMRFVDMVDLYLTLQVSIQQQQPMPHYCRASRKGPQTRVWTLSSFPLACSHRQRSRRMINIHADQSIRTASPLSKRPQTFQPYCTYDDKPKEIRWKWCRFETWNELNVLEIWKGSSLSRTFQKLQHFFMQESVVVANEFDSPHKIKNSCCQPCAGNLLWRFVGTGEALFWRLQWSS